MPDKYWRVQCPGCHELFDVDVARLNRVFAEAEASPALLAKYTREDVMNFALPCPHCEALAPFEPWSHYRTRKHAALLERYEAMRRLASSEVGSEIFGVATPIHHALREMLESDVPLGFILARTKQLLPLIRDELDSIGRDAAKHPIAMLLGEALAIAGSDVGERDDLPDVPFASQEARLARALQPWPDAAYARPAATGRSWWKRLTGGS